MHDQLDWPTRIVIAALGGAVAVVGVLRGIERFVRWQARPRRYG